MGSTAAESNAAWQVVLQNAGTGTWSTYVRSASQAITLAEQGGTLEASGSFLVGAGWVATGVAGLAGGYALGVLFNCAVDTQTYEN